MTPDQQPQEQPGPEWVYAATSRPIDGVTFHSFWHPVLNERVDWAEGEGGYSSRAHAIARCRAISAAALEWAYKVRRAERQAEREVTTMDLPQ